MGPWTATVKRPKGMEIEYMREEMQRTLKGRAAPMIILFVQLFLPGRRHVFLANLVCVLIVFGAQLFTAWAMKRSCGYSQTKSMHYLNSLVQHTGRTICHLVYIQVDNSDIFGRLAFLFVAPCAAARVSSYSTFVGFLIVHVAVLFYRFAGNFSEDHAWLIAALVCAQTLHDISLLKKRGEEMALQKSSEILAIAEDIAQEVLECFCDATARIYSDLDFVQESPSLSTLLNRSAHAGRFFTDFIHMGDRDHYREFMQQNVAIAAQEEERYEANDMYEIDHVKGLRLQSIDLHLEDSMSIPFEVHAFHVRLKNLRETPVYLIGIIERESYSHFRKKPRSPGARRSRRHDGTRLDFDSGKLEPARPAFETKDMELMRDLELLRQDTAPGGLQEGSGGLVSSGPARRDRRAAGSAHERIAASARGSSSNTAREGRWLTTPLPQAD